MRTTEFQPPMPFGTRSSRKGSNPWVPSKASWYGWIPGESTASSTNLPDPSGDSTMGVRVHPFKSPASSTVVG